MPSAELVLTTRRARWCMPGGAWAAGRLRLTERRLVLTAPDDAPALDADLLEVASVRLVRLPRAAIAIERPGGLVRLRCFEVSAVARLVEDAAARARSQA